MRNIWRLYGGWYDGDPSHLKPAPDGRARPRARRPRRRRGAARATRAREVAAAGDLRLAGHLAELAAQAAPDDPGRAHGARGGVRRPGAARRRRRCRRASSRGPSTSRSESGKRTQQGTREDRRREHPGHGRVVGHRRRARADPRRAGRDRRHRRPPRRPARGGARTMPEVLARLAACGPPTSATSNGPSRSRSKRGTRSAVSTCS